MNHALPTHPAPHRLIVAITGATGAIYGVRSLDMLRQAGGIETHLLISTAARLTLQHELRLTQDELHQRADVVHSIHDVGATIASGSFPVDGMLIAPCSMKTLAGIAHGFADNLITRAADVTLKERRRLVLLTRETPLNLAHLRNMTTVTEMGGVIFPPVPAFYDRPLSLDEMVSHTVARALDLFSFGTTFSPAWAGLCEGR